MNININKKYIVVWLLVLILLVVALVSYVNKNNKKNTDLVSANASTTVVDLGNGIKVVGKGDFKIEQVGSSNTNYTNHPDLNVAISFSSNLNEETKELLKSKIDDTRVSLANDPSNLSLWSELGMYYKMAGDYENAKTYWQYVLKFSPQDITVLSNLADLYGFYFKDTKSSIGFYKKAIASSPKSPELYVKLSDVYMTLMTDSQSAKDILDQGLKILPNNQMLISAKEKIK